MQIERINALSNEPDHPAYPVAKGQISRNRGKDMGIDIDDRSKTAGSVRTSDRPIEWLNSHAPLKIVLSEALTSPRRSIVG